MTEFQHHALPRIDDINLNNDFLMKDAMLNDAAALVALAAILKHTLCEEFGTLVSYIW